MHQQAGAQIHWAALIRNVACRTTPRTVDTSINKRHGFSKPPLTTMYEPRVKTSATTTTREDKTRHGKARTFFYSLHTKTAHRESFGNAKLAAAVAVRRCGGVRAGRQDVANRDGRRVHTTDVLTRLIHGSTRTRMYITQDTPPCLRPKTHTSTYIHTYIQTVGPDAEIFVTSPASTCAAPQKRSHSCFSTPSHNNLLLHLNPRSQVPRLPILAGVPPMGADGACSCNRQGMYIHFGEGSKRGGCAPPNLTLTSSPGVSYAAHLYPLAHSPTVPLCQIYISPESTLRRRRAPPSFDLCAKCCIRCPRPLCYIPPTPPHRIPTIHASTYM